MVNRIVWDVITKEGKSSTLLCSKLGTIKCIQRCIVESIVSTISFDLLWLLVSFFTRKGHEVELTRLFMELYVEIKIGSTSSYC